MPNARRGIRQTNPGAVDDDAMARAMRRSKDMMKQLDQAGKTYNKNDVINRELDDGSMDDVQKKMIDDIFEN